ncbi:MAG: Antitoxin [Devosia sp.]|nr:Antitoxin [Devosia sp.]
MQITSLSGVQADLDAAVAKSQTAPLHIQNSSGVDVAIMLSPDLYSFLLKPAPEGVRPLVAALYKQSIAKHGQVYRALAKYEREHREEE